MVTEPVTDGKAFGVQVSLRESPSRPGSSHRTGTAARREVRMSVVVEPFARD
jgi:hypothetical protein